MIDGDEVPRRLFPLEKLTSDDTGLDLESARSRLGLYQCGLTFVNLHQNAIFKILSASVNKANFDVGRIFGDITCPTISPPEAFLRLVRNLVTINPSMLIY